MKQCMFICHMIRDNGKSVVCEGNPYIFCLASVDPTSESPASVFISTVIDRASLAEKTFSAEGLYIYGYTVTGLYLLYSISRLDHLSYKFMAQDRSRNCFWDRSVFDMDITGTDRGQCDLQNDIPLIQDHWPWALLYSDFPISLIYNCFHLRSLLPALFF